MLGSSEVWNGQCHFRVLKSGSVFVLVGQGRCYWGRSPMLAAVASRLRSERDIVWVDLGAGEEGHGVVSMQRVNSKGKCELWCGVLGEGMVENLQ